MTTACNWVNRVQRTEKPIISDGAYLGYEVISTPSGNVYPVTNHVECFHTMEARYEKATYVWDRNGDSTRVPV